MSSRSQTALCAFLVLALVAGPVAGHQAGSTVTSGGASQSAQSVTGAVSATSDPAQEIYISVRANGDARWAVAVEFTLDNSSDTAAFEELAERFEAGNSQYLPVELFSAAAEQASAATGRSMELRDVARTHDVTNGTGRLVLSFTWTDFATVRDESLAVGDAFETTDGQWLGYLTDNQTLYIEPPEGYGIRSRSGTPPVGVDDGTARWEGPVSFSPAGIRIVYAGNVATTTTSTPTTTPPTTTTTTPGPDSGGLPLLPAVGVVAVVAALAAAFVFRRRPDGTDGAVTTDAGGDGGPGADGAASTTDDSDATPETAGTLSPSDSESAPDPTDDAGSPTGSTATATGAEATAESETDGDDGVDEALLSDEERVERLLERNGGRMKQANIVKETGWSNAKVSQLLSAMDEDDRIDKLRIGRENLISFPDEDVADFESE